MLKLGVIGAGVMGRMYCQVFSEYPNSELVSVCDLDEKKAQMLVAEFGARSAYENYNDMLEKEELEAVTVAVPDHLHREPAIACLEAGKDVLCEKPLATTMQDCQAIVDAVERTGKKLMVSYGNRHRPSLRLLKQQVEEGVVGEVKHIYLKLRERVDKTLELPWIDKTTPTFFLLSHMVDLVRWMFGCEMAEVYTLQTYGILEGHGYHTPDTTSALIKLTNGAILNLDTSWAMPDNFAPWIDARIDILGDKGVIYANMFSQDIQKYADEAKTLDWTVRVLDYSGQHAGWWITHVHYFVDAISQGETPSPDAADGMKTTQVLLAIDESGAKGTPIKIG